MDTSAAVVLTDELLVESLQPATKKLAAIKDPAVVLLEVGTHLRKLVLNALIAAPATGATYADVVNQMLNISHTNGDPVVYRTFIRNRFTYREVVVSPTPLTAMREGRMKWDDPEFSEGPDLLKLDRQKHASDHASQNRTGCCGTMQLAEHVMGDPKKMATGIGLSDEDLLAPELKELAKNFK